MFWLCLPNNFGIFLMFIIVFNNFVIQMAVHWWWKPKCFWNVCSNYMHPWVKIPFEIAHLFSHEQSPRRKWLQKVYKRIISTTKTTKFDVRAANPQPACQPLKGLPPLGRIWWFYLLLIIGYPGVGRPQGIWLCPCEKTLIKTMWNGIS